jgi:hypothetical protein
MEREVEKEINRLESKIAYLEKTNRCLAKSDKSDFIWVSCEEVGVLAYIHQKGGLNKLKLDLYNSLKDEFINSNYSCEALLESRIHNLELDDG